MEPFISIRIKRKTAQKFQEFSKKNFKTHSETMEAMLNFFEHNGVSPKEELGDMGRTLKAYIKKRNDAIIAIIKNIEKNQTKPTTAMLESLFVQAETEEEPLIVVNENYKESTLRFEDWDGKDF
ncbi:BfmA/BtgA family mobilization protein [Leeuwenhoekiella sp. A16]|uniref:BfmA/BtgA family mobilization protein n=1 Tax=unclassified Leeuwenhoekiella TaxID=2615029 RepID=UPI003A7FE57B